jgi:hypothetical protein
MTDVCFICVREDVPHAEALAAVFDEAGFSIGGAPQDDADLAAAGAIVVVVSRASAHSERFTDAAQRALDVGKAVIASFVSTPPRAVGASPIFDLTNWTGDADDRTIDPLFGAVDHLVSLMALPAELEIVAYNEDQAFPIVVDVQTCTPPTDSPLIDAAHGLNEAWSATIPTEPNGSPRTKRPAPEIELNAHWPIRRQRNPYVMARTLAAMVVVGAALLTAVLQFSAPRPQIAPDEPGAVTLASAAVVEPIDMEAVAAPEEEEARFSLAETVLAPTTTQTRERGVAIRHEALPQPWMSWRDAKSEDTVQANEDRPIVASVAPTGKPDRPKPI